MLSIFDGRTFLRGSRINSNAFKKFSVVKDIILNILRYNTLTLIVHNL